MKVEKFTGLRRRIRTTYAGHHGPRKYLCALLCPKLAFIGFLLTFPTWDYLPRQNSVAWEITRGKVFDFPFPASIPAGASPGRDIQSSVQSSWGLHWSRRDSYVLILCLSFFISQEFMGAGVPSLSACWLTHTHPFFPKQRKA